MFITRKKNSSLLNISFRRIICTFLNSEKCSKIEKKLFFTTFVLESSNIKNKIERDFTIEDLRKFLELKKIPLENFKKLIFKALLKRDDASIEDLLLLLVLFNKNYPYFKDQFPDNFYDTVCMTISNSIKLKMHYLYTSKMLIHTMNILVNLKLIDNFILDSFMNKCSCFLKNEEYEINDLVCFLSIFSKINILKQDFRFKNLKRFNWPLIKAICDKLAYHFEELFILHKDNSYSYNLKKQVSEEIKNLSKDIQNKSIKKLNNYDNVTTVKKELRSVYEKYGSNMKKDRKNGKKEVRTDMKNSENNENMNNSILCNNQNDYMASVSKENVFVLEILLSISKSLRDLKYIHLSLLNEVAYKLKNKFLSLNEKNVDIDITSVNKIFFIMHCYLFLQLDYHMFYKSILNTFKNYLKFSNNLIVLFFLLAKNKLFPSKTIEIFDSIFLKNMDDQVYDANSLIILLESYELHKYRKNNVISSLIFHLFLQNNDPSIKDKNAYVPNRELEICFLKDTTNNYNNSSDSKHRKNGNHIENKNTKIMETKLMEQTSKIELKNVDHLLSDSIGGKKDEINTTTITSTTTTSNNNNNNNNSNNNCNNNNKKISKNNYDIKSNNYDNNNNNNNLNDLNKMIYNFSNEIKNTYFNVNIDISDKIKILYCLFKLDIYEEKLIKDISDTINEQVIHLISYKLLIKLLLSLCYFSFENVDIYNLIIKNLIKYDIILDNIYLTQLKICELALRTQHVPNVYNNLNGECLEYINYIKNKEKNIEYHIKSDLQKSVKNILLTFNLNTSEEVPIGPYDVDFVEEDETIYNIPKNYLIYKNGGKSKIENSSHFENTSYGRDTESVNNMESNKDNMKKKKSTLNKEYNSFSKEIENCKNTKKLIIEVDGENHFYKNTKCYTSLSKLKHKLLSDLGYVVINIPYFDWGLLKTDLDKKAYIKKLISDNSNFEIRSILPLNQKNNPLKQGELSKIKETIQQCKKKTEFLSNIESLRKKNKLKFLKKKKKHI